MHSGSMHSGSMHSGADSECSGGRVMSAHRQAALAKYLFKRNNRGNTCKKVRVRI